MGTSLSTVAELADRWPYQSWREFEASLGGDVLLALHAASEPAPPEWHAVTAPGVGSTATLDERAQVYVLRPRVGRPGDGDLLLIGRAETSDVRLSHPSVSKLHAQLRMPGPYLRDYRSANGTHVGDRRLAEGEEHLLTDGDRVEVGDCRLRFYSARRFYALLGAFVDAG